MIWGSSSKKIVSNLTKNLNCFYIVCDHHHHSSSKVKFFTANEDCTVFLLCVTQKIGRFGLFHEIHKKKIYNRFVIPSGNFNCGLGSSLII